jgi:hypothetical protein
VTNDEVWSQDFFSPLIHHFSTPKSPASIQANFIGVVVVGGVGQNHHIALF